MDGSTHFPHVIGPSGTNYDSDSSHYTGVLSPKNSFKVALSQYKLNWKKAFFLVPVCHMTLQLHILDTASLDVLLCCRNNYYSH